MHLRSYPNCILNLLIQWCIPNYLMHQTLGSEICFNVNLKVLLKVALVKIFIRKILRLKVEKDFDFSLIMLF